MSLKSNLKILCSLFLILIVAVTGTSQFKFINKTSVYKSTQSTRSVIPGGAVDVNGDLIDDLIILDRGKTLKIGIGNGNGQAFSFMNGPLLSSNEEWTLTAGDLKNEGRLSIVSSGAFGIINVSEIFKDDINLSKLGGGFFAQGSNLVDINNDGWLDYFVCDDVSFNRIYMNDGKGNLIRREVIDFSTTPVSDGSGNYGSEWIDVNMDGFPDLSIAKCRAGVDDPTDPRRINVLYVNNGDGTFTERGAEYNLNSGDQSWVTTFGDIDNDGDLDAFTANHYAPHQLFENINGEYFEKIAVLPEPISSFAFQAVMKDLDNDGFLDIIVSGVEGVYFLYNNGDKTFRKIDGGNAFKSTSSFTVGDFNDDGFPDIHSHNARPINVLGLIDDGLWINTGNDNHYIKFNLQGNQSNRSGIGSWIELYGAWGKQVRYVKGGESYGILNSLQQIFGIGQATVADSVIVRWPSGVVDKYHDLYSNNTYLLQEGKCHSKVISLYNGHVDYFNAPLTISAPEGYSNFEWSDGSTSRNLSNVVPGYYRLKMTDADGCVTVIKPIHVKNRCFSAQTDILPYPPVIEQCNGATILLQSEEGSSYFWNTGENLQFIEVAQSGKYVVTTTDFCGQSITDSVVVSFVERPFLLTGDTILSGQKATLKSDQAFTYWFEEEDDQIPVFIGKSYQTPDLMESKTFYAEVERVLNEKEGNLGEKNFPTSSNEYSSNAIAGNMVFEVRQNCSIKAIKLKTDTPGRRKLLIKDDGGYVIFEKEVHLQQGVSRVELNATLIPGEYTMETDQEFNIAQLGYRSPRLVRTFQNTSYPYNLADVVILKSSGTGPSYFYYFYDWEVIYDTRYCITDKIPVIAFIDGTNASIENYDNHLLKIHPNPATNAISISGLAKDKQINISILTSKGEVVRNFDQFSDRQTDISDLVRGLYFLRVADKKGVEILKFIKH
ncbi:MAG: VCBS repeat-containing protein [Saprospiraceae bacterium]|nr:VCBS repeat-containing protein [Saprospiraceae bacterium]